MQSVGSGAHKLGNPGYRSPQPTPTPQSDTLLITPVETTATSPEEGLRPSTPERVLKAPHAILRPVTVFSAPPPETPRPVTLFPPAKPATLEAHTAQVKAARIKTFEHFKDGTETRHFPPVGHTTDTVLNGCVLAIATPPCDDDHPLTGAYWAGFWNSYETLMATQIITSLAAEGLRSYVVCNKDACQKVAEYYNTLLGPRSSLVHLIPTDLESAYPWQRDIGFFCRKDDCTEYAIPCSVDEELVPAMIAHIHKARETRDHKRTGIEKRSEESDGKSGLSFYVGHAVVNGKLWNEALSAAAILQEAGVIERIRMMMGHYEGGNVIVAGGKILIGWDSLEATRFILEQEFDKNISDDELLEIVAYDFGVSKENIVPTEQPDYHLDIAMTAIANGHVALTDVVGDSTLQRIVSRSAFHINATDAFKIEKKDITHLKETNKEDTTPKIKAFLKLDREHDESHCIEKKLEEQASRILLLNHIQEQLEIQGIKVTRTALEPTKGLLFANIFTGTSTSTGRFALTPGSFATTRPYERTVFAHLFLDGTTLHRIDPSLVIDSSKAHGSIRCRTTPL